MRRSTSSRRPSSRALARLVTSRVDYPNLVPPVPTPGRGVPPAQQNPPDQRVAGKLSADATGHTRAHVRAASVRPTSKRSPVTARGPQRGSPRQDSPVATVAPPVGASSNAALPSATHSSGDTNRSAGVVSEQQEQVTPDELARLRRQVMDLSSALAQAGVPLPSSVSGGTVDSVGPGSPSAARRAGSGATGETGSARDTHASASVRSPVTEARLRGRLRSRQSGGAVTRGGRDALARLDRGHLCRRRRRREHLACGLPRL